MILGALVTGLFMMVVVPVMLFLVIWAVVTAMRIWMPERPLPLESEPHVMRRIAAARGEQMPVGFQEIREDQRRYVRQQFGDQPYHYFPGEPGLFPLEWLEDVHQRRN